MFPLEIAGLSKVDARKKAEHLADLVGLAGRETAYPSELFRWSEATGRDCPGTCE